jgi:hypothetical protein
VNTWEDLPPDAGGAEGTEEKMSFAVFWLLAKIGKDDNTLQHLMKHVSAYENTLHLTAGTLP